MLDKEKKEHPYFIPAEDGIFDQYPEASIQDLVQTSLTGSFRKILTFLRKFQF